MRSSILPAAATLYGTEGSRLADDQSQGGSPLFAIIAALAFVALLVVLVLAQRWLSRRFHRTWNVALAVATVIVLALGIWFTVALTTQTNGVNTAQANGSRPLSTFTQARILALRARADDELTLLTRDSDPSYQADYRSTAADLGLLLDTPASSSGTAGSSVRTQLARAKATFGSYASLHSQIRHDDLGGNLAGAVALASGTSASDLPAISSDLNSDLADGITASQATFVDATSGAASDLDGLIWGLAVGAILVAALVLIGFQAAHRGVPVTTGRRGRTCCGPRADGVGARSSPSWRRWPWRRAARRQRSSRFRWPRRASCPRARRSCIRPRRRRPTHRATQRPACRRRP